MGENTIVRCWCLLFLGFAGIGLIGCEDDKTTNGNGDENGTVGCNGWGNDGAGGVCEWGWDECSDGNEYFLECMDIGDGGEGMVECTCYVNDVPVQECETEGAVANDCEGIDISGCCTEFPDF